jgi:hypothetical protein
MTEIKDYIADVKRVLTTLINSQKDSANKDEKKVQDFFEKYPTALLPALDDVEANYSIYGGLVISQPRFKSLHKDRQPDFLIVTSNSLNLYFNFIELEDPSKKIFNSTNQKPSTNFFQAYNQLHQWDSYGNNEVQNYCQHLLDTLFKDNYDSRTHKKHHYNYILIYGFSAEVIGNGAAHNHVLQNYFKEKNLHHCTYSRIMNNVTYKRKLISVKKDTTEKYRAIALTPFVGYKNDEWSDYHNVVGKEEAIKASIFLTDSEKEDLINKIQAIDKKTIKEIIDEQLNSNGIMVSDLEDFEI